MHASRPPIIITGALGFLGSALAHRLAASGWRLILVDWPGTEEKWRNLRGVPAADFLTPPELLQRAQSRSGWPRVTAVAHLGACSSTVEADADFLMRNNFAYSRALATCCLDRGVRLLYASSAATYGDGSQGYQDDLEALPSLLPLNKYAFFKHAFDLWAWHEGALQTPGGLTGLKYFNVFGPNEYHKGNMRSMVVRAHEQMLATAKVQLFRSYRAGVADGEQTRDFLYLPDAIDATVWLLEHPHAVGIFNVGSGVARSWNALAKAVFRAAHRAPQIEYMAMPEALQKVYQYSTCADLRRLHAAGYTQRALPLEAAVEDYVSRYLEAEDRFLR